MIGAKLAHYEITSHLGTGGMGEVYQATDSKLGRSVAIKLLPEVFTHDVERVARFEREARVLASLNHPHIAAIYGLEESGGRKFLVMELVPGETLTERIKRGPIPLSEALDVAKQIAEALEAAHEKGIIHRDLKPDNVKATPAGKVKVLDFGLAKAWEVEPAEATLSNSPMVRGISSRLTNDPAVESSPRWSEDGKYVFFSSGTNINNLYRKDASGAQQEELLLNSSSRLSPTDVSRDGKFLLYTVAGDKTGSDVWYLPLDGPNKTPGEPLPYLQTNANEGAARFSPDGRYVGYVSNASGENELYVNTFPDPKGGQWKVSQGGASTARWSHDGTTLFYAAGLNNVMAMSIKGTAGFALGISKRLFQFPLGGGPVGWDVSRDGQKFLRPLPEALMSDSSSPITVVLHWPTILKK